MSFQGTSTRYPPPELLSSSGRSVDRCGYPPSSCRAPFFHSRQDLTRSSNKIVSIQKLTCWTLFVRTSSSMPSPKSLFGYVSELAEPRYRTSHANGVQQTVSMHTHQQSHEMSSNKKRDTTTPQSNGEKDK